MNNTKKLFKTCLAMLFVFSMLLTSFSNLFTYAERSSDKITEVTVKDVFGYFVVNIKPAELTSKIKGISINEKKAELSSKYQVWGSKDKYYIENEDIYLPQLEDETILTFKGENDIELGKFKYSKSSKKFTKVESSSSEGVPTDPKKKEDKKKEEETPVESKITSVTGDKGTGFGSYYTLTVLPKEILKEIDGLEVGVKRYTKTDSKIAVFGDMFMVEKESGKIYLGNTPNNNTVIVFKKGKKVLGKFKKIDDTKYEVVNSKGLTDKDLHVKLEGTFESAVVNQKKYDSVTAATGSSVVTKNSDVVVKIAETEKGQEPKESDWKLVKDSAEINLNKSTMKVNDETMGMEPVYHVSDSSVTLNGIPKKAGTFNVIVEAKDELGRTATSNPLTFKVYDLKKVKLSEQLKTQDFKTVKHGAKMEWDMEPWYIELFDKDAKETPTSITVPKELGIWHGSHQSGVYGVLGYAVEQDKEPHQKLILENGTDLTIKNMKILSSVEIVVKNGAKLNFYDSSLYGKITVENGGKFQMNYDSYNNKFLTGSSINGQLVLKDGSTVESSLIYSNANNLTDGKKARRIDTPVVKVEGNVTLNGKVYVRGDESATGSKEDGKLYKGQPAMELAEGAKLTITKGSELGVFGGGRNATTTFGGSALCLGKGSSVEGEGKLIAVGGDGQLAGDGADAVVGEGTIATAQAYLQGGNAINKNHKVGKPYGKNVKISEKTVGYAKDGIMNPTEEQKLKSPYWTGVKAPEEKVLKNADTKGAPTIIKKEDKVVDPKEKKEEPKVKPEEKDNGVKPEIKDKNKDKEKNNKEKGKEVKPEENNNEVPEVKTTNKIVNEEFKASVESKDMNSDLKLMIKKLDKNTVDALKNKDADLYDISFTLGNKNSVKMPKQEYKVTLPKENGKVVSAVYFVNEEGSLEKLQFTQDDKNVTFTTTHFSKYAVEYKTEKKATKEVEKSKLVKTSIAGASAILPTLLLGVMFVANKKRNK
ncbi:hypothetical protein [uncultured Parvimonas sp.]|uniref:hypothetical protein n=1 Tax=uncultured Parvimonas sp. TaxID=747372 RepID=UPI0028041321|nr:hypothetical protein [uncultured Parvimonas sp.]